MAAAASPGAPAAASAQVRTVQQLADGWRFRQDNTLTGAEKPDFADPDWATVSVPHSWNRAGYYMTSDTAHINTNDNLNLTLGIGC